MNPADAIDISMELDSDTVVWIEDPQPELKPILRQPRDAVNFTWLNFSCHAGTHVDAPYFAYQDKWTCDQIPIERLMGPCQVVDFTGVKDTIRVADLEQQDITSERVLLRTQNSFDPLKEY